MTKVKLHYKEGQTEDVTLTFEEYRKMFAEASYGGRPLKQIEVISKDKGPNRITFS